MTLAIVIVLVVLFLGSLFLSLKIIDSSKLEKEGWELQVENLEAQAKKLREKAISNDYYTNNNCFEQANILTEKAISLRKEYSGKISNK